MNLSRYLPSAASTHLDVPNNLYEYDRAANLAHDDAVNNYIDVNHPTYMGVCSRPFPSLQEVAYTSIQGDFEERAAVARKSVNKDNTHLHNLVL